ncbi:MAG: sodium:solute symporter, partial [Bacteroidales bacterium]|nr:sodium:solute symporter [Bacteroidales bacterium]
MFKKNPVSYITLLLLLLVSASTYSSGINQIIRTQMWNIEQSSDTLLQEGLAGSFFGKQGDWFILAGGANFPHGKPWEGGTKTFSKEIFIFSESNNLFQPITVSNKLPFGVAEGAYVSTTKGLLCLGGQTSDGLSNKAILLNYNGQDVAVETYPDLPFAVKNATAAIVSNKVYLLGGQTEDGQSVNQFLILDLNGLDKGWQSLPDFPMSVSAATMSAQQDGEEISLFVFGGRAIGEDNLTNFYSSVYKYKPSKDEWTTKNDIRLDETTPIQLSMAVSAPIGATHIALIGGDDGQVFHQVERAINRGDIASRDSLWINHSGFNDKILLFNTVTDTWFELDNPRKTPVAVSSVVSDGKQIYMSGGEIRPGIRNPEIIKMTAKVETSFGLINYIVLIVYFGGMLFLGFFFMKRNEDTDDFFKAGGRIPWWAAGISIFATTLSAITFISIPAKSYATDWRMLLFNLAILMVVPIIIR